MDIVKRNLFALIRSGALGEYTRLEPMTPCKWRKLGDMALSRGVASTVSLGLRHHQYDQGLGIPSLQLGDGEVTSAQTAIPMRQASMANLWLNHQLKRIRNTERHAIDTSVDTLQILDILLSSITAMMGQDASLRHLVQLAIYLRTRGDKVDFVKLDRWLQKLHVTRAAALQGSFLITAMGFEPDELPFVHSSEPGQNSCLTTPCPMDSTSTKPGISATPNLSSYATTPKHFGAGCVGVQDICVMRH